MRLITAIMFIVLCALPAISVNAQDEIEQSTIFGLAMHGAPKYTAESDHLDYVNPDAPKGGRIIYAATGTFDTVNPFTIKGKAAEGHPLIYDRLMLRIWDEPFTVYPLIAESYSVPDDRSAITFNLNKNARFSDQTPITASDVLFSFNTLKEKGRPNMRRVYKLVDKVNVINPHKIRFTLGNNYDQETVLILAMMPVLSRAYWEGRNFDETLLSAPVTSGPYIISDIKPGKQITYQRNPEYWAKNLFVNKGLYNFDTVIYDYYRDSTIAREAMKAGDLDFMQEWDAGQWALSYNNLNENAGILKEEIVHKRAEKVNSLIFNTRRRPFNDLNVRKALSLAFDHDWINANLFHGQYKTINSFFPNSSLAAIYEEGTDSPTLPYRQKLKEADTLLKESGWTIKNGKRVSSSNPTKALTFEILTRDLQDEKIALSYANMLKKLGIFVSIRTLDHAAFQDRLQSYAFDMTIYFWRNSLSPGTEQVSYWSCEAGKQNGRWNYPGICDKEIDRLSYKIAQARTREDLVKHAKMLDKHLMAGHYTIPLFYTGQDFILRKAYLKRPKNTPLYGTVKETWWYDEKNNMRTQQ